MKALYCNIGRAIVASALVLGSGAATAQTTVDDGERDGYADRDRGTGFDLGWLGLLGLGGLLGLRREKDRVYPAQSTVRP
jgi:MYXO-CTERM domain-containing protein